MSALAILLYVIVAIVGVSVVIYGIGAWLPQRHHCVTEAVLPAAPDRVWEMIASCEKAPEWRSDIAQVERLSPTQWREIDRRGKAMTFETVHSEPPRLLIRRIADTDLPFGGQWTLAVEPHPDGSKLRIAEDGFIKPPPFRFVSRFIIGHSKTMNAYLEDLKQHLSVESTSL